MRLFSVLAAVAVLLSAPVVLAEDGGSCPVNKSLFADTNPKILQSTLVEANEAEEVQSAQ